jgi:hypothetical protein
LKFCNTKPYLFGLVWAFTGHLLEEQDLSTENLVSAFLRKPLYNDLFKEGFGTLFTASYFPKSGEVDLHWPHQKISQSFDNFTEQEELIQLKQRKNARPTRKLFALPHQGYTAKSITYSNPSLNNSATEKSAEITNEFLTEVWSAIKP